LGILWSISITSFSRKESPQWVHFPFCFFTSQGSQQAKVSLNSEDPTETQPENLIETIKIYGQLLAEGFEHGIEVIKDLLMPWSSEERWAAFLELERLAPAVMKQLDELEPSWPSWCDA
jgi:hypothetical protein